MASASVLLHRLVTVNYAGKSATFKLRSGSASQDIISAIRSRFGIQTDARLILKDSDGCDVVIDQSLTTGTYDLQLAETKDFKDGVIELYTAATPNGHKISIALEEMGFQYKATSLDLGKQVQKESWFLKINPNGRIPAIIDHGNEDFQIFESGAILIYLAEKSGKFLPSDKKKRSEALQWLMFQMSGVGPMQGQVNVFLRTAPEKIPFAINRYQTETKRLYNVLEKQLEGRKYLVSDDEPSIADFATFPWIRVSPYAEINIDEFPNLKKWLNLLSARPAFQRGLQIPIAPVHTGYKLYKYEICPFCARVVLTLGWKKIPYQTEVFGYADVDGPTKLIGKKAVPILEYLDEKENNKAKYMGESLDIVKFIDQRGGEAKALLKPDSARGDLKSWLEKLSAVAKNLTTPRLPKLPVRDFATEEDREFFAKRHPGDFKEMLAKSSEYVTETNKLLIEFESLIQGQNTVNANGLGYEDINILPILRNLTVVKAIRWPAKVWSYVYENCTAAGLKLWTDHAF